MKRILALLLTLLAPIHAAEWRNDAFGCSANLPESDGWQPVPSPTVPGINILITMQNTKRNAVFGISVLENPPSTDLRDPKVRQLIDTMLRSFTYQFVGFSSVQIGGLSWIQYPVTSNAGGQITKGVVRFTSGNGRIYGVSLLVGGGKEAAQDVELQTVAASFRLVTPVAAHAPSGAVSSSPDAAPGATTAATGDKTGAKPQKGEGSAEGKPSEGDRIGGIPKEYVRYAGIGAAVMIILILLMKIIGGGSTPTKKR